MNRIALFLLAFTVILLAPSQTISGEEDDLGARVDAFLQERMEQLDIPGAALAIVRDGEIVHLKGYGIANAGGDPVTPQTPFLLASLSKSMTALTVMQLVEAGQMELDAPVQRYLPWFMPEEPITVRQLLHQTSGLDEAEGYQRNLDPNGPDGLEMSIRKLAESDLNHPPGSAFEYSNSNFDVLGLLIETVSGQPYGEYMRDHVFEPLAMDHTFTDLAEAREAGMSSALYPFFGRPLPFDWLMPYSRATQPSAGVIGSAGDMAHTERTDPQPTTSSRKISISKPVSGR
jgi:CubicO group peptidase (beta-lactamase class C family)